MRDQLLTPDRRTSPSILVADDETAIKELVREMLESSGYKVYTASDGREVITCLRENPVDLLITDLVMPEQEGVETICQARQMLPELKVIAISGGATLYLKIARLLGATATLQKPFSMDALISTVERLLGAPTDSPAVTWSDAGVSVRKP